MSNIPDHIKINGLTSQKMETNKSAETETLNKAQAVSPIKKIVYLDNLKVLLTILVILHHAAITYGAPGGWYYQQKTTQLAALFPMTVFVSTDQSFFMGFFFFLSALFVVPSYEKKGAVRFILDRLKRLGIPLAFYSLVLSPVLNYIVEHYGYGQHHSFIGYMQGYHHWIDFGVLWFVAALLLFNLVYILIKNIPGFNISIKATVPYGKRLFFIGFLLGLFTFFTRLVFHVGWNLEPFGFQLGHWPQYILLFIAGIIASKNNWLQQLDLKKGKHLARLARFLILIILPAIFVVIIFVLKAPGDNFLGGWNFTSLTYSLWEQMTGTIIMMALLSIASFKWNKTSAFLKWASENAFGAYIFHPLFLIGLSLIIKSINIDPAFKFLFVGPAAAAITFFVVSLIRKIPFVNHII